MITRLLRTAPGRRVRRRARVVRAYGRMRPSRITLAGTRHVIHVNPYEPRGWAIVTGLGRGHQPGLLRLWRSAVEDLRPDVALDVGVNYGEFLFGSSYPDHCRVIGLEANRRLAKWLDRSLAEHPDRARIELIYALASDAPSKATDFWLDPSWSGSASAAKPYGAAIHDYPPAIAIDGLFLHSTAPRGLLYKIDTEGWEGHVLAGMREILERAGWSVGIIEFQPSALRRAGTDPNKLLSDIVRRFAVWVVQDTGNVDRLPVDGDVEERLRELLECEGNDFTTDLLVTSDVALVDRLVVHALSRDNGMSPPDCPERPLWKIAASEALSTPALARCLRLVTHATALPPGLRSTIHRRIGKHAKLESRPPFEATPPVGPVIRFHHGPTADYLWWLGGYESATTTLFARLARRADVILDIGARDGVYTLFAAAANPSALVIAFEPEPEGLRLLRANVAANPHIAAGRTQVLDVALGAVDDEADLHLSGGNSSLNPDFRRDCPALRVPVRRGDTVLAQRLGGRRVGLIKVDTESTEPDVLEGLRATIEGDRPYVLCEVLPGRTEKRLQEFIGSVGYGAWQLRDGRLDRLSEVVADPTYRQPNLLFAPVESDPVGDACVQADATSAPTVGEPG